MKAPRSLLISLVAIAALLVVLVALAFAPPVQTWLVRRTLAGQPGVQAEIGRVAIGLNTVRLTDVRIQQEGMLLVLPSALIRLPVLSTLGDRVLIEEITARGWTLNLTAPAVGQTALATGGLPAQAGYLALISSARAQAPGRPEGRGFSGVFGLLELPFDLELGSADLSGEVIFPSATGQQPGHAQLVLSGGGLQSGQEGRFVLTTEVRMEGTNVPVTELTSRSELVVRMDTPRSFDRLHSLSSASASGPQVPNGARLNLESGASRDADGERYAAVIRSAVKTIANIQGQLPAQANSIVGTWTVDAQSTDLAPFMLGRPIPVFDAAGEGTFALNESLSEGQMAGTITSDVDRLDVLSPELQVLGPLHLAADFDLRSDGEEVRVSRLTANVSAADPVLSIEALQGFELNAGSGELRVANPTEDLVRVVMQGMPAAWLQMAQAGLIVQGEPFQGEWVAQAREGRFSVRTVAPLTTAGLTVTLPGQPMLQDVSFVLSGSADYASRGWQGEVSDLSIDSNGTRLLFVEAKAGQVGGADQPFKATGRFEADLAGLATQPIASSYSFLSAGTGTGTFNLSRDDRLNISAAIQLNGMEIDDQALPDFTADLRSERHPDGRIEGHLPISVRTTGRTSDVTLAGLLTPGDPGWGVNAQLTSDLLYIEDLELLMALIPADEAPADADVPVSPVWKDLTGELSLGLKKVVYSPAVAVSNVSGRIKIGPEALSLANIGATMGGGGTATLNGEVSFAPAPRPGYGLAADLAVTDFDPAPIFSALNPNSPPALEGRFNLSSRLHGRAPDFAGLIAAAQGDMDLTSRGGVFRALSVNIAEYARAGSRLANLAGVIGLATGDSNTIKYADRLRAATELATAFSEISFDQLHMQLERSSEHHYLIKDLSIISPMIRLLGSGSIEHQPGESIWTQPLSLSLQVAARDQLADYLRVLRLSGGEQDALGYAPLIEQITLDGSLSAIGSAELRTLLARALNGS